MNIKKLLLSSLAAFLLAPYALAYDIPEPNGYVTDQASVFSYEDEIAIEAKIQEIEDSTTAEIGVLVIPTTDGEAISQLAFDVGNTWGVGKEQNDNGLVIVIATEDRAWFMATGYGLEGALPDAITKRIAENDFPPHFREGRYAVGILAALDDIEGYLKNDPSVIAEYEGSSIPSDVDGSFVVLLTLLIIIAIAKSIWVGSSAKKKRLKRSLVGSVLLFLLAYATTMLVLAAVLTGVSVLIDLIIIAGPSGGGSSGGSSGGSTWSSGSSDSSSSWGSSSGGGSFGGGSFGGGGSGGRW